MKTNRPLLRSDAAPARPGSAARVTGELLALLGGAILIVSGIGMIAGGVGLENTVGLDLSNIVLMGSTALVVAAGLGLRFMAPKS